MRLRKDIMTDEDLRLVAMVGDGLGHPLRVELFRFIYRENLRRRDVCNKDLVGSFDYAQSTISQHMNKLVSCGLIDVKRRGTANYYYVNLGMLGRYINAVKLLRE